MYQIVQSLITVQIINVRKDTKKYKKKIRIKCNIKTKNQTSPRLPPIKIATGIRKQEN
jgi:hypothetical protein